MNAEKAPVISDRRIDSRTFLEALNYYQTSDVSWFPRDVIVTDHVDIYNRVVNCDVSLFGFKFEDGLSIALCTFAGSFDIADTTVKGNLEISSSKIHRLGLNGSSVIGKYIFASLEVDYLHIKDVEKPFKILVGSKFRIKFFSSGGNEEIFFPVAFPSGTIEFGRVEN